MSDRDIDNKMKVADYYIIQTMVTAARCKNSYLNI